MTSGWILTATLSFLLLAGCKFDISVCKSCNYNNIPALPTWSSVSSPAFPKKFPPQTQCSWNDLTGHPDKTVEVRGGHGSHPCYSSNSNTMDYYHVEVAMSQTCQSCFRITAPPQYRVELELTSLYLTPSNGKNQCIWQWLNIIDGEFREGDGAEPPMLTLCGTNRPRLLISSGNFFKLNLHSNSAASTSHYVGFSARFKYTDQSPYFPDISNLLPSNVPPSRMMDSAPTVKTLGEVLAPFEKKKKPKKKKNPNAVQALKNRRTEMENRERNNGVNRNNGLPSDTDERPYFGNGMGPIESRQATIPPSDIYNFNNMKRELPPKRSKPMPRDIRILLTVLGVVAAIALLLYLAKKFGYDKIHKNKSGRIMNAYSHFRRFRKRKKKRSNGDVDTVCQVKTAASQSSESGRGTMKTADSPETSKSSALQMSPFPPSLPHKVERPQNHHVGALESGFIQTASANFQAPVTSFDGGKVRDLPKEPVRSRYSSDSSSCDEDRSHQRIPRKRRQRNTKTIKPTDAAPPHRRYCDDAARGHSDHSEQYESRHHYRRKNRTRGKQSGPASHNRKQVNCYSSDESAYPQQPQKKRTWRDSAYS